jgi:hypothetical protein
MIKRLLLTSATILASPLLGGSAAAAPAWSDIGPDLLPTYGHAELYVGNIARQGDHMVAGELHAVLDAPWFDPNDSGSYRDIYFRVLADCRDGTVAIHANWPEGPDEASVSPRDLRRPPPGSPNAKLLRAYCGS